MNRRVNIDTKSIEAEAIDLALKIPDMVKNIRNNLGIPRSELARLMRISVRQLNNIEKVRSENAIFVSLLILVYLNSIALQHPISPKNKVIEVIHGQ